MDDLDIRSSLTHFVGIKFDASGKVYFFATPFDDSEEGDILVADTINGIEMGLVVSAPRPLNEYDGQIELRRILRRPTKSDLDDYEDAIKRSKKALKIATEQAAKLGLDMKISDAVYSPFRNTCTISFFAEHRVDFRELAKILASQLGCYIDLRMKAARDKAKMVGGIGLCGLPLCCSNFLEGFGAISISMAKNQMLTLNIPKLSGPCNKLMCCLAYEDEMYSKEKARFPKVGSIIHTPDGDYMIRDFNILSEIVRIVSTENSSDIKTIGLDEMDDLAKGRIRPKVIIEKAVVAGDASLPESQFLNEIQKEEEEKQKRERNRDKKDRNFNQKQNNNKNNQNNKGNNQQGHKEQNNNQNNNRPRHNRHHGHGNRPNNHNPRNFQPNNNKNNK